MPGKSSRSAAVGAAMLAKAASMGTDTTTLRRPASTRVSRHDPHRIPYRPPWYGSPLELHARLTVRDSLKLSGGNTIFANVGRNHPDYGLTPVEHWASKADRRARGPVVRGMKKIVDLGVVRRAGAFGLDA